jgi:hypothetical protein
MNLEGKRYKIFLVTADAPGYCLCTFSAWVHRLSPGGAGMNSSFVWKVCALPLF